MNSKDNDPFNITFCNSMMFGLGIATTCPIIFTPIDIGFETIATR